jgi:hypothetical protein
MTTMPTVIRSAAERVLALVVALLAVRLPIASAEFTMPPCFEADVRVPTTITALVTGYWYWLLVVKTLGKLFSH